MDGIQKITNMENNIDEIPFTYYGDLLGVSNFYKISIDTAYEKLSFFYNETYQVVEQLSKINGYDLKVFYSATLFSLQVNYLLQP